MGRALIVVTVMLAGCPGAAHKPMSSGPGAPGGGKFESDAKKEDDEGWLTGTEERWREQSNELARGQHHAVAAACGHAVEVTMDWHGLRMAEWQRAGAAPPGSMCVEDTLAALSLLCGTPEHRAVAAGITSITCHYRLCGELPTASPLLPSSGPGFEYAILGGALDKYFCETSSIFGGYDARSWFEDNL